MLYLDNLTLHNFKSFKYAKINFNRGFTCVVGPNGSGKSNVCDALLFALGELSLKRMRVGNSSSLVNYSAHTRRDEGSKHASVKVVFSGDQPVEIMRMITTDGKMGYKLNGKTTTRQEIIDVLKAHKCDIDETNTISQGEITKFLDLSPKERRELIDSAAGVKEFDDKKGAAMKELERVEQKMGEANILLNDRLGFLKELEQEKNEALRYMALSDSIKRLNYSLLKQREQQVTFEYEQVMAGRIGATATEAAAREAISQIGQQIDALNAERTAVSEKLNKRSVEVGQTNMVLEQLSRDMAVKESQSINVDSTVQANAQRASKLKAELKQIEAQSDGNKAEYMALNAELEGKSAMLAGLDSEMERFASTFRNYDSYMKKINELSSASNEASSTLIKHQFELEQLSARVKQIEEENARCAGELQKLTQYKEERVTATQRANQSKQEAMQRLTESEQEIKEYEVKLEQLSSDIIETRGALATYGPSDRVAEVLKKAVGAGLHGRAYELCSYENKYAAAVSAAALAGSTIS